MLWRSPLARKAATARCSSGNASSGRSGSSANPALFNWAGERPSLAGGVVAVAVSVGAGDVVVVDGGAVAAGVVEVVSDRWTGRRFDSDEERRSVVGVGALA